MCMHSFFLHILEQRIGFAQQIQVKPKLVEYKYENKLVFQAKYALAAQYFIVWEVGFIHHDRVTSYNLWRHILHMHSKSRLYVIDTDSTFLLFFFQMNTETRKYHSHKGILTHIYSWYRPHMHCYSWYIYLMNLNNKMMWNHNITFNFCWRILLFSSNYNITIGNT